MKQRSSRLLLFGLVSLMQTPAAPAADRLPAHNIIAQKLIDVLPADLAPLYRDHIEAFESHVAEPALSWPSDPKLRSRGRWHDVQADLTAADTSPEARQAACRAFPRDATSAGKLYREHGRRLGGTLPWAIDECHRELVRAFRSSGEAEVLAWSGYLTHFAADAVNPLRVSTDGTANRTPNARLGDYRGPHPDSVSFTARERYGRGLVGRWAGSFRRDITLANGDYAPIADPRSAAFSVIAESLGVLDRIMAADRECIIALRIDDRHGFMRSQEAYYESMRERCGEACTERLRAGALFAANLIGGAWQDAGTPPMAVIRARNGSLPTSTSEQPDTARFVGSKHSDVFHNRGCRFAKQITGDNEVWFDSALEARRAERRACRHCKPE